MNRMRKEGYTLQQIGDTFNISREAIRQILDKKVDLNYTDETKPKAGLPPPKRGKNK